MTGEMIADVFKDAQRKRIEVWAAGHLIFRSDHQNVEVVKVSGVSCVLLKMKGNDKVEYSYYLYPNAISGISVAEDIAGDAPEDHGNIFLD